MNPIVTNPEYDPDYGRAAESICSTAFERAGRELIDQTWQSITSNDTLRHTTHDQTQASHQTPEEASAGLVHVDRD